ncbi:hypothetical protein ACE400_29460, partial [Salmonella enterica]|uniref:hypothetical protein n=1 Tax=Salmonella enterica TaxID=28901 RepID=UPI003D2B80EB
NNHVYLVSQDYDINTAENMFLTGIIEPYIPANTFELFRFILDIQYYDPNDESRNIIHVHTIDLRKIRGYGGFSEESLSVNVVPSLIVS